MKTVMTCLILATLALTACGKDAQDYVDDANANSSQERSENITLELQYGINVDTILQHDHVVPPNLNAGDLHDARQHLQNLINEARAAVSDMHHDGVEALGNSENRLNGEAADAQAWITAIDARTKELEAHR